MFLRDTIDDRSKRLASTAGFVLGSTRGTEHSTNPPSRSGTRITGCHLLLLSWILNDFLDDECRLAVSCCAGFESRGAIDGTHITVRVFEPARIPFRSRKGGLSQNVLAGCTLDLEFFYVCSEWEGYAKDEMVFETCHSGLPFSDSDSPIERLIS